MTKPTLIERAERLANNLKAIADHMDPVIPTQADAEIIFDLIELARRVAPASPSTGTDRARGEQLQSSEARALTAEGETLRLRDEMARIIDPENAPPWKRHEAEWRSYSWDEALAKADHIRSLLSTPLVVGADKP